MSSADDRKKQRSVLAIGLGLALGSGLGTTFGAVFGAVVLGTLSGAGVGLVIGAAYAVISTSGVARGDDNDQLKRHND